MPKSDNAKVQKPKMDGLRFDTRNETLDKGRILINCDLEQG